MFKTFIAQRICTTNDTNGNPRRGWAIAERSEVTKSSGAVAWVDEGYEGHAALTRHIESVSTSGDILIETFSIHVRPSEYRRIRKLYGGGK